MIAQRIIEVPVLCRVTTSGLFFFFFQAEDGIRDLTVTGVQTCALPILRAVRASGTALPFATGVFDLGVCLDVLEHVDPSLRSEVISEALRVIRRGLRSEEHTSELQSQSNLVCRLLLEKKRDHVHTALRL